MNKSLYRRRAQLCELPRHTGAVNNPHRRLPQPQLTGRLPRHKAESRAVIEQSKRTLASVDIGMGSTATQQCEQDSGA